MIRCCAGSLVALLGILVGCGGQSGPPLVVVTTTALDFANADCGAVSGQSVEVRNDGDSDLHWSLSGDAVFAATRSSGTVAPHSVSSVTVTAAIPESAMPGQPFVGNVRLLTDDPTHAEIVVPVKAVAQGAVIELPFTVDVGVAPVAFATPPASLVVKNTGDVAVDVTFGKPSATSFSFSSETVSVAPGKNAETSVTYQAPKPENASATSVITVRGPVCGVRPTSIALTAVGTGGVLGFSPGTIDFGRIDCGASASQTVKLINTGNVDLPVTVTRKSDGFKVVDKGVIQPFVQTLKWDATVDIPKESAVTPGLYDDAYEISAEGMSYTIPVKATARGAILAFGAAPAFGGVKIGDSPAQQVVSVTNSGNATTTITGASTGNVFVVQPTFVPLGSGVVTVEASGDPDKLGVVDSRALAFSSTGAVCGVGPLSASARAYDRAIDATAGDIDSRCYAGTGKRIYCSGVPVVGGIGYPTGSPTPRLTTISGGGVRLGERLICGYVDTVFQRNVTCLFGWSGPNAEYSVNTSVALGTELYVASTEYGSDYGHVCIIRPTGALECMGSNASGAWGTGALGPPFTPTWTPAMSGASPVSGYAGFTGGVSVVGYGFALVGGTVRSAGSNGGASLGKFTVPNDNSNVVVPYTVEQLTDATSVSAWAAGGCVVHAGGNVTCWGGGNLAPIPVGQLTDVVAFAGGPSRGCALRAGGVVSCLDGNGTFVAVPNIVTPVKRVQSDNPGNVVIIESDGRVTAGNSANGFARVPGFD